MAACTRMALVLSALCGLAAPPPAHARLAPVEDADAIAEAAVAKARQATRDRDYAAAIEHFREAMRHRPTAKLQFNIGVCHHRLMVTQSPGSSAYEEHRGAAVEAYNRYLEAAPGASDTKDVVEMIRALGGTPYSAEQTEPWSIDLVEPDEVPAPPSFDEGGLPTVEPPPSDGPPDPPPEPLPPPTEVRDPNAPLTDPRWGLSFSIPVLMFGPGQLGGSDRLVPAPNLGLAVGGNGFLGSNRALWLGGEIGLTGQPISAADRPRLSLFHAGLVLEYHRSLGKQGRAEIGGGGLLSFASQTLLFSGTPRLRCAVSEREASRRNGLAAVARVYAAVLMGKRRNHALTFRLGPGIAVLAPGTVARTGPEGEGCENEPSPFQDLGVDEGPSLVLSFDVGYSPRF